MKNFTIFCVSIILIFFGCAKPIELGIGWGRTAEKDVVKTKIGAVLDDPSSLEGMKIIVKGKLICDDGTQIIEDRDGSLLIAPVGYEIPDSLAGGRIICFGSVFYHEEMEKLGIAADAVKIFPPRR